MTAVQRPLSGLDVGFGRSPENYSYAVVQGSVLRHCQGSEAAEYEAIFSPSLSI